MLMLGIWAWLAYKLARIRGTQMPQVEDEAIHKESLVSNNARPELANNVAEQLGTTVMPRLLETFKDDEIKCQLGKSVRGGYVFVIGSHGGGGIEVDKAVKEQELLIAAARQASADKVIAVVPYLGYARSDRKTGRESIAAQELLRGLERAGADTIV